MNHNPVTSYTEPYRQQTRSGDDLEQKIAAAIASAHTSVELAVQELRLPKIAAALVERQQAGVKVRVILENTYARPFSTFSNSEVEKLPERERGRYEEFRRLVDRDDDGQVSPEEINQGDALVMLDQAKVPRIDDTADGSAGSNLMHHKFVVIDGQRVIVTSGNFTPSDLHGDFKSSTSRGNANNLLQIESAELAALFQQEFNLMWGDGPGGKPDSKFGIKKPFRPAKRVMVGATAIAVQFSPTSPTLPWSQSSNGLISKTLSAATRSIAMALFVFSDQALVNSLEPVQQRGATIRTLIEPEFAYRSYSEGLDMLGVALAEDCKLEPDNHLWKTPIATVGVPSMPPGDLLHHKFGIVDQQTVITGSHNWTNAANGGNDETVLVIHSPVVAAHFEREFERLYEHATLGLPPAVQRKAEAQQDQCSHLQVRSSPRLQARSQPPSPSQQQSEKSVATAPKHRDNTHTKAARTQQTHYSNPVNLNTATQEQLETLPGVGPGLAKRIIAARGKAHFTCLEDLDHVSGVGPALLDKLRDQVTW